MLATKDQTEIKETIPLTTVSERRKYQGINLHKEPRAPQTENYKTLMKEITEDTEIGRLDS